MFFSFLIQLKFVGWAAVGDLNRGKPRLRSRGRSPYRSSSHNFCFCASTTLSCCLLRSGSPIGPARIIFAFVQAQRFLAAYSAVGALNRGKPRLRARGHSPYRSSSYNFCFCASTTLSCCLLRSGSPESGQAPTQGSRAFAL